MNKNQAQEIFLRHIQHALDIWLELLAEADDESLAAADREKENLFRLLEHGLVKSETRVRALKAALTAFDLVERRGYWAEWLGLLKSIEPHLDEIPLPLQVTFFNRTGQLQRLLNQPEAAEIDLRRGLTLAETINDRRMMAVYQHSLADLLRQNYRLPEAKTLALAALDYCRNQAPETEENKRLMANVLNTLGETIRAHKETHDSLPYLKEAADIAESLNIPYLEGRFTQNVALALFEIGQPHEALAQLKKSIALLQGPLDRKELANSLLNQGFVHATLGQWPEAVQSFEAIDLPFLSRQPDKILYAKAQNNLGFSLLKCGELARAERYLMDALASWQKLNQPDELANTYKCLGDLYREKREMREAVSYYQLAIQALQPLRNHDFIAKRIQRYQGYIDELEEKQVGR